MIQGFMREQQFQPQEEVDFNEYTYYFNLGYKYTRAFNEFDKFEEYYNLLKHQDKKYFELIPNHLPVKEYYDIDGEQTDINIEDVVETILDTRRQLGRGIVRYKDIVVLSCNRQNKFSLHLIFNTDEYYKNNQDQKDFVKKLKNSLPKTFLPNIDLSVYNKNSLLRIIGSIKPPSSNLKEGTDEVFKPYKPIELFSSVNLKNSLVRIYGSTEGLKMFVPPTNPTHTPTLEDEDKDEWFKNISLFKSCAKDYEDWSRVVFSLYNIHYEDNSQFCINLIHAFSRLCPSKYDYVKVNNFISNIKPTSNERRYKYKNLLDICKEKNITRGTKWLKSLLPSVDAEPTLDFEPPEVEDFVSLTENYYWIDFIADINKLNDQKLEEPIYRNLFLQKTYKVLAKMNENWIVRLDKNNIYYQFKRRHLPLFYCKFLIMTDKGLKLKKMRGENYMDEEEVLRYLKQYTSRCFSPIQQPPSFLNTWTGFKAVEVEEDLKQIEEDIAPLLYHIKKVICNGDQKIYDYFIGCWFKTWFNNPTQKLGVIPVLIGDEGSGKSTIPLFIKEYIIGEYQSGTATSISSLTNNFNGILLDKMFIFLNEIENFFEINNKDFDAFKSLITDEMIRVNIKHQEVFMLNTYFNFMITTNNEYCIKMSKKDRRYFILNPNNKHLNDKVYFTNLYDNYFNQDVGNKFFTYCKNYQPITEGLHLRDIPTTTLKEEMIMMTETSYRRYFIEFNNAMTDALELKEPEELPFYSKLTELGHDDIIIEMVEQFLSKTTNGYKSIKSNQLYLNYTNYCEKHKEKSIISVNKLTREAKKEDGLHNIKYNENNKSFKMI